MRPVGGTENLNAHSGFRLARVPQHSLISEKVNLAFAGPHQIEASAYRSHIARKAR